MANWAIQGISFTQPDGSELYGHGYGQALLPTPPDSSAGRTVAQLVAQQPYTGPVTQTGAGALLPLAFTQPKLAPQPAPLLTPRNAPPAKLLGDTTPAPDAGSLLPGLQSSTPDPLTSVIASLLGSPKQPNVITLPTPAPADAPQPSSAPQQAGLKWALLGGAALVVMAMLSGRGKHGRKKISTSDILRKLQ